MLAMVAIFRTASSASSSAPSCSLHGPGLNIAFSFYSSLKTSARAQEVAIIYRFSRWQRFAELDLPFSTIGLSGIP